MTSHTRLLFHRDNFLTLFWCLKRVLGLPPGSTVRIPPSLYLNSSILPGSLYPPWMPSSQLGSATLLGSPRMRGAYSPHPVHSLSLYQVPTWEDPAFLTLLGLGCSFWADPPWVYPPHLTLGSLLLRSLARLAHPAQVPSLCQAILCKCHTNLSWVLTPYASPSLSSGHLSHLSQALKLCSGSHTLPSPSMNAYLSASLRLWTELFEGLGKEERD